jgi:Spy/CpxP family protein refolding chaperone
LVNYWKVILATMVIFGTGVVTGGLLVRASRPLPPAQRIPGMGRASQPPSPGGARVEFLRRMTRELDLTTEQRERVDKIIRESQERTKIISEPVAPLLRQETVRVKQEFREALTPEQRARFDELVKKQQLKSKAEQHRQSSPRPEHAHESSPGTN